MSTVTVAPPPRRRAPPPAALRTARRLHRWISIFIGLFLAMWLVTGIVMVLPAPPAAPAGQPPRTPVEYRRMELSPADAVRRLEEARGAPLEVRGMSLERIRDVAVYRIALPGGESILLDAGSGRSLEITPELVRQVALDRVPAGSRPGPVELLTRHDLSYSGGPLPTYRIALHDDRGTHLYVSPYDGTVRFSNRVTRVRGAIVGLHEFQPVAAFLGSTRIQRLLLVLVTAIALLLVATGYLLVTSRRR